MRKVRSPMPKTNTKAISETGEYLRMGSSEVRKTNVRVVAATNLNMRQAIDDGRFREDLYYRLNTVEIRVPALRERREDIPVLFRKFAVDFCTRYRMPSLTLTDEATRLLQNSYWRGNIRQLKNTAEQIAVIEMNHHIDADTLRKYLPEEENQSGLVLSRPREEAGKDYSHEIGLLYNMLMQTQKELHELREQIQGQTLGSTSIPSVNTSIAQAKPENDVIDAEAEVLSPDAVPQAPHQPQAPETQRIEDASRELIQRTLERCGGNRKAAAAQLGISERTLYRKIKEYDL